MKKTNLFAVTLFLVVGCGSDVIDITSQHEKLAEEPGETGQPVAVGGAGGQSGTSLRPGYGGSLYSAEYFSREYNESYPENSMLLIGADAPECALWTQEASGCVLGEPASFLFWNGVDRTATCLASPRPDEAGKGYLVLPCTSDADCLEGLACGTTDLGKVCLVAETKWDPACSPSFCLHEADGLFSSVEAGVVCGAEISCCDGLMCSDGVCVAP